MNQQLLFLLTGIAGFIFHSLIKLKSLNDDSVAANLQFNVWKDYIIKDIYGILASLFSPCVWLLLFGEIAAQYPGLEKFSLTSFFVMGALGSYVLQLLLGQAKKQIRKVVDEKTNIADGVTPIN
jgi:hypothetical protein